MKKKEGFEGQEAIVLPKNVVRQCEKLSVIQDLYITDIGYYPRAKFHYRERPQGADEHILIYCVSGCGYCDMGKKKLQINPNEYLIVPQGRAHAYGASEEQPWTIYWAHFKGKLADHLSELLYRRLFRQQNAIQYNESHINLFRNIYQVLQLGYSKDNLEYVTLHFSGFLTAFVYNDKFNLTTPREQPDVVDTSILYLKQHIGESLTLKQIADHVHLSVSHFSGLFHKKTGFSPIEYFNHLKMQKACQLLHFTELRIYEVAAATGIEDPYYFSRIFKENMGVSPKEYRMRWQLNDVRPGRQQL